MPVAQSAWFEFDYPPDSKTFILELDNAEKIGHARRVVSGEDKIKVHVSGIIVKRRADYNPSWQFHLAPQSISFFDIATEVCDASIQYVADHLDEVGGALLPRNRW